MNEQELINKLKQLKKFEPSQATLAMLDHRIKERQASPVFGLRRSFIVLGRHLQAQPILVFGAVAVCILLLAVLTERNSVWQQAQMALVRTEIALAPNRYQKAVLSLLLSQKQLDSLQRVNNKDLAPQLAYATESLSQTNTYVHSLNLKGEPGKYTMQQCLTIYRAYSRYLDSLKVTIQNNLSATKDQSTQTQLQSLFNQTSEYDQQVDAKLKQY